MKLFFKIFAVCLIVSASYFLTGCAYNNIKERTIPIRKSHIFIPEKTVIKKVAANYKGFKNISGRAKMLYYYDGTPYEESVFYKYLKGKCLKFAIMDMYGNVVFSSKINNNGAIFTNTYKTKKNPNSIIKVLFNKKYKIKSINSYKRIFKSVRLLLNLENTEKINKSDIFYNTENGYFFEYKHADNGGGYTVKNTVFNGNNPQASDMNGIHKTHAEKTAAAIAGTKQKYYYIYVNNNFLINKIAAIRNKKFIETITFSRYITKSGIYLPLKIDIDDYLYNVKMIIKLSKGSKLTLSKNFKN
jgi:hypothetical protein